MPFISQTNSRELQQTLVPFEPVNVPSFGETFAASVGQVFDEGLSISRSLNNEGFRERNQQINEYIRSSGMDASRYSNRRGRFDYDRFARENEGFKTDAELNEERNAILEQRRTYAQDVLERGSGTAQFLGAMTGYMLDPLNIATMGIATVPTAAKSLTVLGRTLLAARNTAGLTAGTELLIQPLVYMHKQDIGSPYEVEDALSAIAFAAAGGFALGGFAGGVSGYISKVRQAASKVELSQEAEMAVSILKRTETKLKAAPEPDYKAVEARIISDELEAVAARVVSGPERLELERLAKAKVETPEVIQARARLEESNIAEAEIKAINNGEVPARVQQSIDKAKNEVLIESEINHLRALEETQAANNQPRTTPEQFTEPETPRARPATKTEREADVIRQQEIDEAYNREMAEFEALENPVIRGEDEMVDARGFIKEIDDELSGLESVLVCVRG